MKTKVAKASHCWFSKDEKDHIVLYNNDFILAETAKDEGECTNIGSTIEEARLKLKELGKENKFENF